MAGESTNGTGADWREVQLNDVTEALNTGLDAIRRAPIVSYPTNLKCLRIQDISNNKPLRDWGFTEVTDTDYEKYRLRKGEIIMARTCSTGINFLVKEDMQAVFNNGLARLRLNHAEADPRFIYYVFKSRDFVNYIDGISGGTSVQLNMKVGDLAKFKFRLPPLKTQKAIVEILGALDAKIELNRRMNETLESLARRLFKWWFVDFGPVRAKMDGRPPPGLPPATAARTVKEWIDDGILLIGDGYRAKRTELGEPGLPFVRAGNLQDHGFRFDNAEILSEPSVKAAGEKVCQPNDVAFTSKGTVGRMTFVTTRTRSFVYSPQVCWWRVVDADAIDPHVLYRWMESPAFMDQVSRVKGQTDMADYVSLRDQRDMLLALPPIEHQRSIGAPLESIDDKIAGNLIESETLAALRDTLLPRLLSGELRVDDVERDPTAEHV